MHDDGVARASATVVVTAAVDAAVASGIRCRRHVEDLQGRDTSIQEVVLEGVYE